MIASEAARGLVVGDTGADCGFDDGAPVYGFPGFGGCYAEYVTCHVERLAPIPVGLRLTDAAAAPIDVLAADPGPDRHPFGRSRRSGPDHRRRRRAWSFRGADRPRPWGERRGDRRPASHEFVHRLGAAVVVDHTDPGWPDRVRDVMDGGADRVLACAAPSLGGAARAARDGATIATPVGAGPAGAGFPGAGRVRWRHYDAEPSGSRLIRMAPQFDDGSISVQVSARYYWQDAADAHRLLEQGHTRGKIVLIVDDDLAASLEV
jgi:NADPH:quinone reductase-like Zn-dependent oxidoreductase